MSRVGRAGKAARAAKVGRVTEGAICAPRARARRPRQARRERLRGPRARVGVKRFRKRTDEAGEVVQVCARSQSETRRREATLD